MSLAYHDTSNQLQACSPCKRCSRYSHSLPSTIIDIRFQFPRNHSRNTLLQPHVPIQSIIPLLIQEELSSSPQAGIRFAVFVQVGGRIEAAVLVVQVKYAAFADIQEEAGVNTATIARLVSVEKGGGGSKRV